MSILHKIKRLILIIISGGLILIIGVISWYKFAWPRYIDKSQIIELADEINNSEPLPENFYLIYDKLYPKHRQTTIAKTYYIGGLKMLFSFKPLPKEMISPSCDIGHLYFLKFSTDTELRFKKDFNNYFSFAINKYTKPEKCFDYYIHNYDFLYNRIGLDSASLGYYEKSFDMLTQDEIIGLIAMLDNSALYNPKRLPELHKEKVVELKKRL